MFVAVAVMWLVLVMILSAISVTTHAIVLNLYHRSPAVHAMPRWVSFAIAVLRIFGNISRFLNLTLRYVKMCEKHVVSM